MNRLIKIFGSLAPFALPVAALAQQNTVGVNLGQGTDAFSVLGVISNIFGVLIPILITLGVIWVIWGVIKYATAKDDDAQSEARKTIISGIIALFVIVSIWGLVAILNRTFNVEQSGANVGACQPVYDPNTNQFVLPPQCQ